MAPEPQRLRFFVDETSLGLGKGLSYLRKDVVHTGHSLIPEVSIGSPDPAWIPAVAKRQLIVLTRDKRIRTKHGKLLLLNENCVRIFVIGDKRDLDSWETLRILMRHWDAMERTIAQDGPGPWFRRVGAKAITPMEIPDRLPR